MDILVVVGIMGNPDSNVWSELDSVMRNKRCERTFTHNEQSFELPRGSYVIKDVDTTLDDFFAELKQALKVMPCFFQIFVVPFDEFAQANCLVEQCY